MGGKSKAPKQPDPVKAAKAQGQANIDTARISSRLSNPNVFTPYGSQTVTYNGDTPTVNQNLSPEAQRVFNNQLGIQGDLGDIAQESLGSVRDTLGSSFDTSNLPQAPINPGMTAQNAIMSRLNPQLDRQRSQLETQLANQGIMRGSEAYNNAMQEQGQRENDLLTNAALQGINLDTSARQNALQEQLGLRELPLNELGALMNQSQVSIPQFQGYQGQNIEASPLMAANQQKSQNNMNAYNAQVGQQNAFMQGLFGLGSAALPFLL